MSHWDIDPKVMVKATKQIFRSIDQWDGAPWQAPIPAIVDTLTDDELDNLAEALDWAASHARQAVRARRADARGRK